MTSESSGLKSAGKIDEEELETKYQELLGNGSWIAIVTALRLYKSLSSPEIATLLDIKKTTLFNYISQLEELGFVRVDEERSAREFLDKGARARKYYMATELTEEVLNTYRERYNSEEELAKDIEETDTLSVEEIVERAVRQLRYLGQIDMLNYTQMIIQMNNTIENIALKEIEMLLAKVKNEDNDEELIQAVKDSILSPYTSMNFIPHTLDIYSPEQSKEFLQLYYTFIKNIQDLKKKFDASPEKDNPTINPATQYLYFFASPINTDVFERE